MTISTTPSRFLTTICVFDTLAGLDGKIIEMNLDTASVPAVANSYTGPHITVEFSDQTKNAFTLSGQRIDSTSGVASNGVTLLTLDEKNALLALNYPING